MKKHYSKSKKVKRARLIEGLTNCQKAFAEDNYLYTKLGAWIKSLEHLDKLLKIFKSKESDLIIHRSDDGASVSHRKLLRIVKRMLELAKSEFEVRQNYDSHQVSEEKTKRYNYRLRVLSDLNKLAGLNLAISKPVTN